MVKVSYPLKQGLKQYILYNRNELYYVVKVSYPLKQGLKHDQFPFSYFHQTLKLK